MIYFKKKIILIFTLSVIAMSCANTKKGNDMTKSNNTECQNSKEGKLVNMTGLDGCGWMIELKDGGKLNPINLDDFNIKMTNGKKISLNYIEKNDMAGICMAGEIVEIKCIVEILEE